MATTQPTLTFRFLGLPPELRLMIYEYVFADVEPLVIHFIPISTVGVDLAFYVLKKSLLKTFTGLARANKEIREEVLHIRKEAMKSLRVEFEAFGTGGALMEEIEVNQVWRIVRKLGKFHGRREGKEGNPVVWYEACVDAKGLLVKGQITSDHGENLGTIQRRTEWDGQKDAGEQGEDCGEHSKSRTMLDVLSRWF